MCKFSDSSCVVLLLAVLGACSSATTPPSDGGEADLSPADYSHTQLAFFSRAEPTAAWAPVTAPIFWGR